MYIRIAKDKDMHYSHDRVKELDKERFDELRKGLGRCENNQFFLFEDDTYIYLKIKGGK
tara:strand:+ start:500 stop:676 length:177 start_codon:yes stop_codon:yes gene_type:complete